MGVFLLLAFVSQVLGQGPPLNPGSNIFKPSDYGAHAQVFDMEKAPQGGVWFGTFPGPLYYDGNSWQQVQAEPRYHVMDLEVDSHGRVWAGGKGGLGYLEVRKGSGPDQRKLAKEKDAPAHNFRYVSLLDKIPDSLRGGLNFQWIHTERERVLFNGGIRLFILNEKGLYHIDPRTKSFYASFEVGEEVWIIERKHGFFKVPDRRAIEKEKGRKIPAEHKLPGSDPFGDMAVRAVLKDVPGVTKDGEVLVISRQSGIFKYRYGNERSDTAQRVLPFQKEHHPEYIRSRLYDATRLQPEKNPWNAVLAIGTLRRGTILLDSNGRVVLELDQKTGMPSNIVIGNTVTSSKGSKALWSCTNKGIARWNIKDPRSYARIGEELAGGVEDLVRNRKGLWASSSQGLYIRRNRKGGIKEKDRWQRDSMIHGQTFDLLELNGSIFLGAGNGGCFKVSYKKGKTHRKPLFKANTYAIDKKSLEDRDLILGGGHEGLYVLMKREEGWERVLWIKKPPQEVLTLRAGVGKAFVENSSGENEPALRIWASFWNKGAFMVEVPMSLMEREGAIKRNIFTYEEGKSDSSELEVRQFDERELAEGEVNVLRFQGQILLGTDSGLYRPKERSKGKKSKGWRFVPHTAFGIEYAGYPVGPGKGNEPLEVSHLKEGADGEAWIKSSRDFPERLHPKEGGGYEPDASFLRGMDMGSVQGFYPDSNRVTWISSNEGVTRFDDKVERKMSQSFPCLMREVRVSLPEDQEGEEKRDSILFAGAYRVDAPEDPLLGWSTRYEQPDDRVPSLPFSLNALSFRYASPFLEREEELVYKVKLEGFEERWGRWTKKAQKAYNYLPEGSYTFKVKAKNVYGVKSELASYRFRILPPWYRTWAAYGGYGIAGIGLIGLLVWLNGRRLMAQKSRLEKIVDDRTKEIREQKDKVEEQREIAEERRDKIEEAHREITDSIDYAQKIQYALLQSEEHVSPHLPEHFILLKPQSKVSGDFYWSREHKGHLYIAAVDCTGHGVPGAFMSMLGISQLNEIMNTDEVPTAGEILTELKERVIRELSGAESDNTAKDGMDAAMVKIPLGKEQGVRSKEGEGPSQGEGSDPRWEVEFAGAQNPLYVIRKGIGEEAYSVVDGNNVGATHVSHVPEDRIRPFKRSSDGIEIKGDGQPVGYDEYAKDAFTTVKLKLRKGDMLYIFSDGYADQFGGPKGKKFRYAPFKDLLVRIHEKSLKEQKQELDDSFEDWKNESQQEQIDDVVVIGLRL